jgi:hypothetical protein
MKVLSRKFIIAFIGLTIIVLNSKLELGISSDDIKNIVQLLFAYLATQGTIDFVAAITNKSK